MTEDDDSQYALSELQIDVMRVLWQRGEASVAEVAAALSPRRELAHTTVATLLTRLAKRGAVEADRTARQLCYRARISESQVRRSMVAGLIDSLFGGDSRALVAHLVDQREVGADDLAQIERLLRADDDGSTRR